MAVSVEVGLPENANFATLYPKMKDGQWNVHANPNGELTDLTTEKKYATLFWEAKQENPFEIDITRAHCVSRPNLEEFLETSLETYGLSVRERTEFMVYWMPYLEHNNYTLIEFLKEEYAEAFPLTISPVPDTTIRVFALFRAVTGPIYDAAGKLPRAPKIRKGFTAVEWGGSLLDS